MNLVEGPTWSTSGLDIAAGLYPLRVEKHVRRMVEGLLPGVITVTPHARYVSLHAFVWLEAERKSWDLQQAQEFARRCEVVFAGISMLHEHSEFLPAPHGADDLVSLMDTGVLKIAELSAVGQYSPNPGGWTQVYRGAESRLGAVGSGTVPKPGPRVDAKSITAAFGELRKLASRDSISATALRGHSHLCLCQAPTQPDGSWLQHLLASPTPTEGFEDSDQARIGTIRLLAAAIHERPGPGSLLEKFIASIAHGPPLEERLPGALVSQGEAWRGTLIRNYSVTAWRRLWAWLVEELGEDAISPHALATRLADTVEAITLRALIRRLPDTTQGNDLLAPELELQQSALTPQNELMVLALGARRLEELSGVVLRGFAGEDEPLSPAWFARQLGAAETANRSLRDFSRDLALLLIDRAYRVALSKMQVRPDGRMKIPMRIRERNGLLIRVAREGFGPIATGRVETFGSILIGAGLFKRDGRGWRLTPAGRRLIAA